MRFSKITFIAKIAIDFLSHPHLPVTHYSHIHHTSICVCYDHGLYKIYFVILYKPTPQIYILLTLDFMGSCVWVESNNFCPLHHRTTTKNTQASSMCNEKGKNKKKESRWTLKMVDRNCVWKSIRWQYLVKVYWR